MMAALNDWNVVDANNNATPPDGWPEFTMQYSEVNDTGRAVQGTVRRFWGDSNGSLNAGGVADAYTLTLNEAYSAYFDGMWFACQIPSSNTGASTIDVNGIGAQAIKARDGSDLTSGTLDAGGIYEFRYDGTNFQLMGTLGSEVGVGQATLTNSNAVDLTDTDVALRTGAVDPDSAQHLEMTLSELQSKSDATTAATLDLNPLGGSVNVGAQSGSGVVDLYANGNPILETNDFGVKLSGVAGNDTGVDAAADSGQAAIFLARNGDQGGTSFKVNATSGAMEIFQTDTAGNEEDLWIAGNRNAAVELYFNNNLRFSTAAGGVQVEQELAVEQTGDAGLDLNRGAQSWELFVQSDDSLLLRDGSLVESFLLATPNAGVTLFFDGVRTAETANTEFRIYGDPFTSQVFLGLYDQGSGTRVGFVSSIASGDQLQISSEINGRDVSIAGTDSGGTSSLLFSGNPDGASAMYDEGNAVALTESAANGGFLVNNQLTGGGFERVLTVGDFGVNPTKKVMDGFVTATQSSVSTTFQTINTGFSFTARSDASTDRFRGRAIFFVDNNTISGTNPGLRLVLFSDLNESVSGLNHGRLESIRTGFIQSANAKIDTVITGIDVTATVGERSKISWDFGYAAAGNSGTYTFQFAQNVANPSATNIFYGSNAQIFDYGS